jgi:hypothetical protein
MSSIDGKPQNNPPAGWDMSLQRVPAFVVILVAGGEESRPRHSAIRQLDVGWRGLIEQAARSWPITLRLSLLSLVVAGGATLVASTIGVAGQVAMAAAGLRAGWRRGDPSVADRTPESAEG